LRRETTIVNNFIKIVFTQKTGYRIVRETLSRIIAKEDKEYFQQCYIWHRKGIYYLLHWSEFFALDDKNFDFINEKNIRMRNKIAKELVKYELIEITNPERINFWRYFDSSVSDFVMYDITEDFVKFIVSPHDRIISYNVKHRRIIK